MQKTGGCIIIFSVDASQFVYQICSAPLGFSYFGILQPHFSYSVCDNIQKHKIILSPCVISTLKLNSLSKNFKNTGVQVSERIVDWSVLKESCNFMGILHDDGKF